MSRREDFERTRPWLRRARELGEAMTTQHPADREPQTEAGRALLDGFAPMPRTDAQELHRRSAMGRRVKVAAGILAIEAEAAARSASDTPRDRSAVARMADEALDYIQRAASSAEPLTALLITIAETARDARTTIAVADHASSTDEGLHRLTFPPHPGDVYVSSALCSCGEFQYDADSPGDLFDQTRNVYREHTAHVRAALRVTGERSDSGLDADWQSKVAWADAQAEDSL